MAPSTLEQAREAVENLEQAIAAVEADPGLNAATFLRQYQQELAKARALVATLERTR